MHFAFFTSLYTLSKTSQPHGVSHFLGSQQPFQTALLDLQSQQQPRSTASCSACGSWRRRPRKVMHGDPIHLPLTQSSAPTAHVATA